MPVVSTKVIMRGQFKLKDFSNTVHSKVEKELLEFLNYWGIKYIKPVRARYFGQYYLNTDYFPDVVIGCDVYEVFGYYGSDYEKKKRFKMNPLNHRPSFNYFFITPEALGWKTDILQRYNITKPKDHIEISKKIWTHPMSFGSRFRLRTTRTTVI